MCGYFNAICEIERQFPKRPFSNKRTENIDRKIEKSERKRVKKAKKRCIQFATFTTQTEIEKFDTETRERNKK